MSLGGLCVNFSAVGARRRAIDAILGGDSEILRVILAHIVEASGGRFGADWLTALRLALMNEAENRRNEQQRRHGRADEAADHGAAERRVQFGAERHGAHADNHRQRRHENRPETGETGVDRRRCSVGAFRQPLAGEADDENAVGGGDAHAHDRARQSGNRQRRAGDEQHPDDAGERSRQCADDDERIKPGLEVDDDQQVDEHHGERDADEELPKSVGHRLNLPSHHDGGPGRDLFRRLIQDFLDIGGDGAEIPFIVARENVYNRLHGIMRDDGVG